MARMPEGASQPIHLRPHAEVAERVLLPGDPGRALRMAQQLVVESPPRMLNHNRGLWGYTGVAADGGLLTIQSTGMGGPSAAIIAEELIALGARRLVRVGTCGALVGDLALGAIVVAERVLASDGASAALGAGAELEPDADLVEALAGADPNARRVTAVSTDLFYDPDPARAGRWTAAGAEVVEMEAAALLAVAARHGATAGCLLGVTDLLAGGSRRRIEASALLATEAALGRVAARALGAA